MLSTHELHCILYIVHRSSTNNAVHGKRRILCTFYNYVSTYITYDLIRRFVCIIYCFTLTQMHIQALINRAIRWFKSPLENKLREYSQPSYIVGIDIEKIPLFWLHCHRVCLYTRKLINYFRETEVHLNAFRNLFIRTCAPKLNHYLKLKRFLDFYNILITL